MGGIVKAVSGKKRRPAAPPPPPAPVAKAAPAPEQKSVAPGQSALDKQAITSRRGRSQLVSGRTNTATRGGISVPR
jgi:hypothetical protein